MIETDREAVRLLNTCKQTGGLTSPALPHGGSSAAGGKGTATIAQPTTFDFTHAPHAADSAGGTERFCFSAGVGRKGERRIIDVDYATAIAA